MSNEEYTHRAEWPEKPGIIETHYGTLPKMGLTAEEATEGLRSMQAMIKRGNVDQIDKSIKSNRIKMNEILERDGKILIHRGNLPMKFIDNHTHDATGYLKQGSPHLPFEKSAVKVAEDVHKRLMELDKDLFDIHKSFYAKFIKLFRKNENKAS